MWRPDARSDWMWHPDARTDSMWHPDARTDSMWHLVIFLPDDGLPTHLAHGTMSGVRTLGAASWRNFFFPDVVGYVVFFDPFYLRIS